MRIFNFRKFRGVILALATMTVVSSCERDELPVEPVKRDALSIEIPMGSDYSQVIWYDFSTNSIVKISQKSIWDLSIDCRPEYSRIYMNMARVMTAAKVENSTFEQITSKNGLRFRGDASHGHPDSLAFGRTLTEGSLYVVDRGFNDNGTPLGYFKLSVEKVETEAITIRCALLNGQDEQLVRIEKNSDYNVVSYSFTNGNVFFFEPPKNTWDLCFSQYSYTFLPPDPYGPYLVSGVLLNQYNTSCATDFITPFADISSANLDSYQFSTQPDIIGYEWKDYNFDTGVYEVYPWMNYIIHDRKGFYRKLHFTGFYNNKGEKGFPLLEHQTL